MAADKRFTVERIAAGTVRPQLTLGDLRPGEPFRFPDEQLAVRLADSIGGSVSVYEFGSVMSHNYPRSLFVERVSCNVQWSLLALNVED